MHFFSSHRPAFHEGAELVHVAAVGIEILLPCEAENLLHDELLFKVSVPEAFRYFLRVRFHPLEKVVAGEEVSVICVSWIGLNEVFRAGILIHGVDPAVVLELGDHELLVCVQRILRFIAGEFIREIRRDFLFSIFILRTICFEGFVDGIGCRDFHTAYAAHHGEPFTARSLSGVLVIYIMVFIGNDGGAIYPVAADMKPSMFLIFPVVVIPPEVIMVDGSLIADVFYSTACIYGEIFPSGDLTVVVLYVLVSGNGNVSAGKDFCVIGFFLNNTSMDGPGEFPHGIVIVRRSKMRNLVGDVFIGHVPSCSKFLFIIHHIHRLDGDVPITCDRAGPVVEGIFRGERNIARCGEKGAFFILCIVLVVDILCGDSNGFPACHESVFLEKIPGLCDGCRAREEEGAKTLIGEDIPCDFRIPAHAKVAVVFVQEAASDACHIFLDVYS